MRPEGAVLAGSQDTVIIEGSHLPPESLNPNSLEPGEHKTVCSWKGTAQYYDVAVNDKTNRNAAWYYSDPEPAASVIKGCVAFWKV